MASAIADAHLAAMNELDAGERRARMVKVYADDVVWVDPFFVTRGAAEFERGLKGLHAKFPKAVFTRRGNVESHHGLARFAWTLTGMGGETISTGEDVLVIKDARVSNLYVFIDSPSGALPSTGVRGLDHAGMSVPSNADAIAFFANFDCAPVTTVNLVNTDGRWRVDGRGEGNGTQVPYLHIVTLRCGAASNIELFEFHNVDRNTKLPANADIGWSHVAFYVEDVDAMVAKLRAKGIEQTIPASTINEGQNAGERWAYVQTPWGYPVEIVSYPSGQAYQRAKPAIELWTPPPRATQQ
ncbi:MAG TPA: VOC family protein [Polyangiaceae bacterium]|nr:VOC family protein [Polyangiaceae bacterium]